MTLSGASLGSGPSPTRQNPAQAGVALTPAFKKISKKGDAYGAIRFWTENGPRRISYLWHCRACDYEFEAVAFYDASHPSQQALAA